ncbi:MAG: adenylate/guanylate cyclase domain-containing protein [Nitratireductor sp.]
MNNIDRQEPDYKPRMRLSLRWLLALSFGGLVAISVAAVLAISVMANFANTYSLLNERAISLINGMVRSIKVETDQAERVVSTFATEFSDGRFNVTDRDTISRQMTAFLRAVPVVEGILIFDGNGEGIGEIRAADGKITPAGTRFLGTKTFSQLQLHPGTALDSAFWGPPVSISGARYHNISQALVRDSKVEGHVVVLIDQASMNRIMADLGKQNDTTVFVLTSDNQVVGHSGRADLFRDRNTIPLNAFPDQVLHQLPNARVSDEFAAASSHEVKVFETGDGFGGYVFITRQLPGYADHPYTLGAYFSKTDIGSEIRRAMKSMLAGLAGLAAAVLAAILLGKRISRPMARIADTAGKFSAFKLHDIDVLPRSRITEIDEQAQALNRLSTAMIEFSRYVPHEIVSSLVRYGPEATRPVEREVTIMFTDIAGFTTISERMNASQTAELLNRHFARICEHVDATHGTVDKFMGDGLMAFWGAPLNDPDHVAHALAAARAIAASVIEENVTRRARDRKPLRLRIGIHTGKVVVGNIGGEERQNYTMVGDAVNVTQRLENMGKEMMRPQDDVIVLVSGAVVEQADSEAGFIPAGTRVLPGREKPVQVCLLKLDSEQQPNIVRFPGASSA